MQKVINGWWYIVVIRYVHRVLCTNFKSNGVDVACLSSEQKCKLIFSNTLQLTAFTLYRVLKLCPSFWTLNSSIVHIFVTPVLFVLQVLIRGDMPVHFNIKTFYGGVKCYRMHLSPALVLPSGTQVVTCTSFDFDSDERCHWHKEHADPTCRNWCKKERNRDKTSEF